MSKKSKKVIRGPVLRNKPSNEDEYTEVTQSLAKTTTAVADNRLMIIGQEKRLNEMDIQVSRMFGVMVKKGLL